MKDRFGFSIGAMEKKRTKRHRLGVGEFQYKDGFNVARMEPGYKANGPTLERMDREALFLEAVYEVEPKVLNSLETILSSGSGFGLGLGVATDFDKPFKFVVGLLRKERWP